MNKIKQIKKDLKPFINIMDDDFDKVIWIVYNHIKTNHRYDQQESCYYPYYFHLYMVASVAEKFIYLIPEKDRKCIRLASWGHDLIEDCRLSYNDVRCVLGDMAAEIIYACSNEKGKTRKERASEKYYKGIVDTYGATFVKLCDRIANVKYSLHKKSRMLDVYKKENNDFISYLGYNTEHPLFDMFLYLEKLLCDYSGEIILPNIQPKMMSLEDIKLVNYFKT